MFVEFCFSNDIFREADQTNLFVRLFFFVNLLSDKTIFGYYFLIMKYRLTRPNIFINLLLFYFWMVLSLGIIIKPAFSFIHFVHSCLFAFFLRRHRYGISLSHTQTHNLSFHSSRFLLFTFVHLVANFVQGRLVERKSHRERKKPKRLAGKEWTLSEN